MKLFRLLYIAVLSLVGLMLYSCANIGSPEGGPLDIMPPQYVKSTPAQGAINVKGNKIEITFDEIVNIKDQQKKVSVSPVQKNPPVIKALGKKVTIEFRDEMLPNTTYNIDFSNAIEDNNEGNPMEGFTFAFSTGDEIDSLQISGLLLRARDLEPMKHVVVGLHSNLEDSAFTHVPLERISRTNDRGQFTLRNLKPGKYHVFALNDMDGNYRMARTEDIAFLDEVIVPAAQRYESVDTVFTFDNKIDTIVNATHTMFTPNDVLLTMFNEDYHSLYLKTTTRPSRSLLHVLMSTESPEMPQMRIIKPQEHAQDWCVIESTPRNDSIFYWITDSALIKSDSIVVEMKHLYTDSTDNLSHKTDTITFAYRKTGTQLKQEAQEKKAKEQQAKRIAELKEKQEKGKELSPAELRALEDADKPDIPKLECDFARRGNLEVYDTIKVHFATPVAAIDPKGVHLELKQDTLWVEQSNVPAFKTIADGDVLNYMLPMELEPEATYRLTIDSLAVQSVYGLFNDPLTSEFKISPLESYANLTVHVNVTDHAFIELLDQQDRVVRTVIVKGGTADFENLLPNTYYMRLILDANGNGKWDTGNYARHQQPEEVYYFPKRLKMRKNWDMDESWNIYATAYDLQKPAELVKNKPEESKNKLQNKRDQQNKKKNSNNDEDEDETEFGTNPYNSNKYQNYQQNKRR
ncbi:MAG: Ig-like domain-containing protein [Muribaculaceae bacterium]|nr:Ig-like domain-containing protein [Muribaculaceae bacterium]